MRVTPEDIEEYRERGYWISPRLIDDNRIELLHRAVDRLFAGEVDGDGWSYDNEHNVPYQPSGLQKITNGWWANDEIRALVTDPTLGRIAAALMDTDEVRLWHDQVVCKPASDGRPHDRLTNIGWHQDFAYWSCCSTSEMITAWVALQDTDLSNGGMRTLVGSHKWGLVKEADTFYETDLDSLQDRFQSKVGQPWVDEPCILKAGQVSFHHALCFHGSGPNTTNRPRRSIIAHYMPRGCAYRARVRYHRNVRFLGPRPRDGQLFANEYFPLAFSDDRA